MNRREARRWIVRQLREDGCVTDSQIFLASARAATRRELDSWHRRICAMIQTLGVLPKFSDFYATPRGQARRELRFRQEQEFALHWGKL